MDLRTEISRWCWRACRGIISSIGSRRLQARYYGKSRSVTMARASNRVTVNVRMVLFGCLVPRVVAQTQPKQSKQQKRS
jgi:hypothetical protein